MAISVFNPTVDRGIFTPANGETHDDANHAGGKVVDVPVLIIGGGPAGLLQAYLLSRLGVQNLVVERYPERLGAPKAHALSPRSMEICRQFGLDTQHIRNLGTRREDAYWVNFLTTLSGEVLGQLPYERMDVGVLDYTPEMIHNIPQPDFEQYVAEELAHQSNSDVRKGVSFVSLEQHGDSVTTVVEERTTGHLYKVRSRFVIACDGARSKVRQCIGIESDGEDSYETMMTIHFSANLREVVGDRVGMLHWLFDPMASGFIIAYDLSGNAVLITNFDSDKYPVEDWSEDLCRQVLQGAIGKDISPKILSYRPWILSRKVAKSYRKRNVFLAGDAAHSFPPTGGLGLNSGLADVHNLAFKLAAVFNGVAAETLLDTYDADRRHVAEVNSRQSVKNGQKIFGLLKALGTAGISDINDARQNLLKAIQDPVQMKKVDNGVEEQREHFDNLNLHVGYVYGDMSIPEHASHFKPTFVSGARLPHAWLEGTLPTTAHQLRPVSLDYVRELSIQEVRARQYSTLDLCDADAWTFLLPPNNGPMHKLAEEVKNHYQNIKFNHYSFESDFKLLPGTQSEGWIRDSGLQNGHALLIRPDQHIFTIIDDAANPGDVIQGLNKFLGF